MEVGMLIQEDISMCLSDNSRTIWKKLVYGNCKETACMLDFLIAMSKPYTLNLGTIKHNPTNDSLEISLYVVSKTVKGYKRKVALNVTLGSIFNGHFFIYNTKECIKVTDKTASLVISYIKKAMKELFSKRYTKGVKLKLRPINYSL